MLNQPAYTTPNWHSLLNENFATLDDKMQFKALCTYDSADNVFSLNLLNIPAALEAQLPAGLPDTFTVVARFPTNYAAGAKIRIGATDFTPKYAAFEAGDTLAVSFNQPEYTCFFSAGGGSGGSSVAYYNAAVPTAGWSSAAPYTQTVAVAGILATDVSIFDILLSDDITEAKAEQSEWVKVSRIDTADGEISLTCFNSLPGVDLNIQMMVVK